MAYTLPANADSLRSKHAVTSDRLFDPAVMLSDGELVPSSPDLVLHTEELKDSSLSALHTEADTLDLLANPDDSPSGSGARGIRRFILLTILFGAVLRYLTSRAFYDWAAEVFDPLEY
jgi:hypothetical protein